MGKRSFALLVVLLGGCGSEPETSLDGIYEVSAWTENTTSCDAEGPSVLGSKQRKFFYVRWEEFFGAEFLNAVTCEDLAQCEVEAADETIQFQLGESWAFESGSDSAGWTGSTVLASGFQNEPCTGSVTDHVMTSLGGGGVRIDSSARTTQPFERDSEGFCSTDDAIAAAEGQPCVSLEVVVAARAD